MAHWDHRRRTFRTKLVYYGPAGSGKTANLRALDRIGGEFGRAPLLSFNDPDDKTLLFDFLPLWLQSDAGYRVGIQLYAVPGQVRHETIRKVVLAGADAVVFVADSDRQREQQNQWSLQDLRMNLKANGDPGGDGATPITFQCNKQDLPQAARPGEVCQWLGVSEPQLLRAVATTGDGVAETLAESCRRIAEHLRGDEPEDDRLAGVLQTLDAEIDRALHPDGGPGRGRSKLARKRFFPPGETVQEQAIAANVLLAEMLAEQGTRLAALERETAKLRRKLGRRSGGRRRRR